MEFNEMFARIFDEALKLVRKANEVIPGCVNRKDPKLIADMKQFSQRYRNRQSVINEVIIIGRRESIEGYTLKTSEISLKDIRQRILKVKEGLHEKWG